MKFAIKVLIFFFNCAFFACLPTSFSITTDGQTLTLDGDYYLGASSSIFGAYSSITIDNTTGSTRTATLDGAGYTVYFPYNTASSTFQFTGDGVVLTVQNVSLQGYNPAAVSYASANAKIIFGDNTKIILDRDLSILYTDRTWTCSGDVVLDGKSLTLTASGESALSMQGLNKTLTIKNTILKPQGPDSIACLDGASKIVLSNSTLELGRDGLAVNNGYIDIDGKVIVRGIDISYSGTQSLALLSKRYQNLGFVPLTASYAKSGLYSLNLADVSAVNTTFTVVRVSKDSKAYYSTSTNPYSVTWTEIVPSAVYKSIDIGDDGQMWVVKTDRSVHRVTRGAPPTLLAATNITGDYVCVGGAGYVFVLNTATGTLYQCNNPTGTADTWTVVSGIYFPRSVAVGNDGTLWFVSIDGRVYKKSYSSDKIEQIFDGIDKDIAKISVSGTVDSNCVALLSSMPKDGRVLVSQSGGPLRDLGINKVVDVGIGVNGSMLLAFDNTAITENATFGMPIYAKINSYISQMLTMDRSLTFSSDKYLTIKSGAELELTGDVAIRYQPVTVGEFISSKKRHLLMQDGCLGLRLNRSVLDVGTTGLAFESGKIIVDGENWLYSGTVSSNRHLEFSSNFNVSMETGSNLSVIGPIDYANVNRMAGTGYFQLYGSDISVAKTGVTNSVVLKAINDAYEAGFKAVGTNFYKKVAILDNSSDFSGNPYLFAVSESSYSIEYLNLETGSLSTGSLPYNFPQSLSLSTNGWHIVTYGLDTNYRANTAGPTNTTFTGTKFGFTSNSDALQGNGGSGDYYRHQNSLTTYMSGTQQNYANYGSGYQQLGHATSVTTLDGGRPFSGADLGTDKTMWIVNKFNGLLYKTQYNPANTLYRDIVSQISLPVDFSGSVISVSAKGTWDKHFLAIASSTGQAFLKQNDGPWDNLGLSGVIDIAVGVRGTIAVLLKRDTVHGSNNPVFVRPGVN